jgi:Na+/H+-dicarboxylate symporter
MSLLRPAFLFAIAAVGIAVGSFISPLAVALAVLVPLAALGLLLAVDALLAGFWSAASGKCHSECNEQKGRK